MKLFHPIASLPPEIMAEIFLSACPPWNLDEKREPVNPGLTPLFLGGICRSWRNIAWSTPALWCSFIVHIKFTSTETKKELLVQWITRAKGLLLSIAARVKNLDDFDGAGKTFVNSILEVLVSHSMRWRVVNLDICPDTSMECILSGVKHRIPNLVSLTLKLAFLPHYGLNHLKMDMFEDSPFLRELSITTFFLDDFYLDWTQLTTLHVKQDIAECLEALRRCSESLIHFSMGCFIDPDNDVIFDLNPVVAVHLTTLEVTDSMKRGGFYEILPFMTLPALRQLSLPLKDVDSINHINAMFSRSSFPALEVLILFYLNRLSVNGEWEVLDLLATFPSLIKVRLTGEGCSSSHSLTDSFIDMLHPLHRLRDKAFPVVILPNLQVFEYEGPLSLNVTSLAAMLSYRWRRPQALIDDGHGHMARLTSVTIKALHGFHLSEENTRAFEILVGEGMDLTLEGFSVEECRSPDKQR